MTTDADNGTEMAVSPAVDGTPPTGDGSLRRDLPCRCGYNLRGLPPSGRCPECGGEVAEAIALAAGALPLVDPWWRRQITEAALLAFASAALFGATIIPSYYYRLSGAMLAAQLAVGAAAWVTQWWSAVKLSRAEPGVPNPPRRAALPVALGVLATAYLAAPFLAALVPYSRGTPWPWRHLDEAAGSCGVLLAVLFYLRVRRVFLRLGAPGPAAQAGMLAFVLPVLIWAAEDWSRLQWSDPYVQLGLLSQMPTYVYGDPGVLRTFVLSLWEDQQLTNLTIPHVVIAACCGATLLRLILQLRRVPLR